MQKLVRPVVGNGGEIDSFFPQSVIEKKVKQRLVTFAKALWTAVYHLKIRARIRKLLSLQLGYDLRIWPERGGGGGKKGWGECGRRDIDHAKSLMY